MAKKSKKVTPKKAVKKITKKPAKKIVKKVAPKKVVKKPVKKVAPKKIVKKAAPKKAVKKISKPAAKKQTSKPAVKKETKNKNKNNKPVASKVTKAISPAPAKKAVMKNLIVKGNVTYMNAKNIKKAQALKNVELPAGYAPKEKEEYMNPMQVEYFRRKLVDWKKELLSESTETLEHLKTESWNEPDPSDQATIVEQTGLELRTRDRYRKLINKIDAALNRIEIGEYGYCEVTGDPIGIARLEARPIATMTIAAQEQHEMEEKLNMEG